MNFTDKHKINILEKNYDDQLSSDYRPHVHIA